MLSEFRGGTRKIAVVGLGYVGLPLLIAFEKYYSMIGFDVSSKKIDTLRSGVDNTDEVGNEAVSSSKSVFSNDPSCLKEADFIIVAVPTPIDEFKTPDLRPVISATECIAANLKPGATIVYESTVYPGVTEEICKPILEQSGYVHKRDFHLGYSPERINPGDREHRFESILKIVSGDSPETLELVASIYQEVVKAGVYCASSIKVAEAAKVIENTQRDVNIALMNELAMVFHRLGIDTKEVLEAAGTKWNFIKMMPGMVGGHCIGVDPYYLTHKAQQMGYHPEMILSGRRINDNMSSWIAGETVKCMIKAGKQIKGARVLVLGLTFKENCPDTRNSKVRDLISELKSYSCDVLGFDPYMSREETEAFGAEYEVPGEHAAVYDAVVLAVSHAQFQGFNPSSYFQPDERGVFIDVKSQFAKGSLGADVLHWRL
jgi:UDP-N-acetyl-D-galactosamine dehydrogenase